MLLLSNDSGYNSPCGGAEPSSSFGPLCFSYALNSRRRLCFDSSIPLLDNTTCDSNVSEIVSQRSRKIARRLLCLCDSFEEEFDKITLEKQQCPWITTTFRYISSLPLIKYL
ncbi:hypothetical protein GCK32_013899 [Trichostrongylus colubriformis]|uniref:Uncharacterized protein n=1 Tax=Trichostrongylus colubriformis TaxID=6319 RepID=A0AAN8IV73_TRICO